MQQDNQYVSPRQDLEAAETPSCEAGLEKQVTPAQPLATSGACQELDRDEVKETISVPGLRADKKPEDKENRRSKDDQRKVEQQRHEEQKTGAVRRTIPTAGERPLWTACQTTSKESSRT